MSRKKTKSTKKKPTKAYLDGDILIYKAAFWADSENPDLIPDKVERDIKRWLPEGVDKYIITLSCSRKENFRRSIWPNYKLFRDDLYRPEYLDEVREHIIETYDCLAFDTIEADDIMGILGSYPDSKGIIVSNDKDMKGVPCKLYRPMSEELLEITPAQADRFFYIQALCGDPTDGYFGVKGVGVKTAEKILGTRPDWSLVENTYIKNGYTRDDAIKQARLARILRHTEWDNEKSIIKLWEPPSR